MKILGLTGPKRSGKDTVCSMLGSRVHRIGLADFLKDTCSAAFELPRRYFDDDDKKEAAFGHPIILTRNKIGNIRDVYSQAVPGFWERAIKAEHIISGKLMYNPRHVLQVVGTDFLRLFQEDIHLQAAKTKLQQDKLNVITDCRFENEIQFVKDLGGVTAYVWHPAAEQMALNSPHISEAGIPQLQFKCDWKIPNSGELHELEIFVKAFVEQSKIFE